MGEGALAAPTALNAGDLVVFDESARAIRFEAQTDTVFVLGCGVPHPHDLFMGPYSVHTSAETLRHRGGDVLACRSLDSDDTAIGIAAKGVGCVSDCNRVCLAA